MTRRRYIRRRVFAALLTAFMAISLNFVVFRALPGDAVGDLSRVPDASPALKAELRKDFGLDRSLGAQYVLYLKELAGGNLGVSYVDRQPVGKHVLRLLGNTIPMVLLGTLVAIALGVLSGTVAAARRGRPIDAAMTSASLTMYALPIQWVGLMAILIFQGILPTGGMKDEFLIGSGFWTQAADRLEHMILPASVLGLTLAGQYTLLIRSSLLETFGEDYIVTAKAKGLTTRRIVIRHGLRNAMLPIVTLMALSLGFVFGGAILVETVFNWPGIGYASFQAVTSRDYPMLQGIFLVLTLAVVVCNLVADLLYGVLDPRVTE